MKGTSTRKTTVCGMPVRGSATHDRTLTIFLIIVMVVVALDQLTKYAVRQTMTLGQSVVAIPGLFDIHYILNNGAAFGILQDATVYFLVIAAVMVVAIVCYLVFQKHHTLFETVTLSLIAAGAIGNAIDRAMADGHVTDFIATSFMDFPIFNVADCAITIGCLLFVIALLRAGHPKAAGTETAGDPAAATASEAEDSSAAAVTSEVEDSSASARDARTPEEDHRGGDAGTGA